MDDDQTASLSHVGILNSLSSRAALLLGLVERAFKAHGEARATWLRQAALEGFSIVLFFSCLPIQIALYL